MSKTALLITAYHRPELLQRCLNSLLAADLSQLSTIYIHDDNSTDKHVLPIIAEFIGRVSTPCVFFHQPVNVGIKGALSTCYKAAFIAHDVAINLDADAIVKPDFVNVLLKLKQDHPNSIVSGFNCDHPKNPVLSGHNGYVLRQHCNGINMVLSKADYEAVVKPALQSQGNWDFNSTHKLPFVISKPSVVQHIGANQSTMGHAKGDVACDFKLLSLPEVCLFGIDAHDPAGLLRAAEICTGDIDFGAEVIITQHDYFRGREGYSKWMIASLWDAVKDNDCTHVLTIHGDGFIQNPMAWDNEWLKLDMLGATWVYKDGLNVGQGGFSLRSKKFIEICSRLDITDFHPEDCKLSRKYRPFLEKEFGLVWGTEEQANRFSIEAYGCGFMRDSDGLAANRYCGSFGFHGYGVTGLPIQPAPKKGAPAQRVGRRVR